MWSPPTICLHCLLVFCLFPSFTSSSLLVLYDQVLVWNGKRCSVIEIMGSLLWDPTQDSKLGGLVVSPGFGISGGPGLFKKADTTGLANYFWNLEMFLAFYIWKFCGKSNTWFFSWTTFSLWACHLSQAAACGPSASLQIITAYGLGCILANLCDLMFGLFSFLLKIYCSLQSKIKHTSETFDQFSLLNS